MKILVVLTGGTIGSRVEGNTIDVNEASAYNLISKYESKHGKTEKFSVISPVNILSENLRPNIWVKLINSIEEKLEDLPDGIIMTHGSDTLAYTSAFMGMMFGKLNIPFMITASNYELEDPRSVGLANFEACVDFIRSGISSGVFTVFGDGKISNVYISTRINPADSYLDRFSPFGGSPFGKMEEGRFTPCEEVFAEVKAKQKDSLNINNMIDNGKCRPMDIDYKMYIDCRFENEILVINPYPGMNYSNFTPGPSVKAVLHNLYHSATACTGEDEYSIMEFIKRCEECGIDVYLNSFKDLDSQRYASSESILNMKVNPMCNTSAESAYVKLLLAYNQKVYKPQDFVKANIYFEEIESCILKR